MNISLLFLLFPLWCLHANICCSLPASETSAVTLKDVEIKECRRRHLTNDFIFSLMVLSVVVQWDSSLKQSTDTMMWNVQDKSAMTRCVGLMQEQVKHWLGGYFEEFQMHWNSEVERGRDWGIAKIWANSSYKTLRHINTHLCHVRSCCALTHTHLSPL